MTTQELMTDPTQHVGRLVYETEIAYHEEAECNCQDQVRFCLGGHFEGYTIWTIAYDPDGTTYTLPIFGYDTVIEVMGKMVELHPEIAVGNK